MQNTVEEFLGRWDLHFPELVADTGHARVWKVQSNCGPAALKLYRRQDRGNEKPGTNLLVGWRDRGAVRILEEARSAVLMEWLDGPSLGDIARAGRPEDAVKTLAETAACLHAGDPVSATGMKPLQQVFAPLAECTFAAECPAQLRNAVKSAIALSEDLLDSQPSPVPLHGDFHPDNVIMTLSGPRIIDAKGYLGDPAFELANALRHPKGMPDLVRQPLQIETCLSEYSKAMSVPRIRLAQWAAAKCALSIYWRSDGPICGDAEADLLNLFLKAAGQ